MSQRICSIFYFLYFSAFGIFVPYWSLYLNHLHLNSMQIANVLAIHPIMRILLLAVLGYLADRWKSRRIFLIVASFAQLVPLAFIPFFHSYGWLLFLIFLFSVFNAAILPFTDATVQEEQEKGNLDYGRTRMWGTLSFILLAAFYGKFLDHAGDDWILYGFIMFLIMLVAASFAMPEGKIHFSLHLDNVRALLRTPATWIFLGCVFLMQASHGTFYGFYSIHLSAMGISGLGIGLQWAASAGSEIIVFFFAARILGRYSPQSLIPLCCLAAVVRWYWMGSTTSFVWLTSIQLLHAFTFGAFHIAGMNLIHKLFPEGSRSLGQAFYTTVGPGVGHMTGLMVSGYFWDRIGNKTFYVSSGIMVIGLLLSLMLVRKMAIAADQG